MAQHPWTTHNKINEIGIVPSIDGDVLFDRSAVVNAATTVYTVPTGKKLLLFNWTITARNTAVASGYAYAILSEADATPKYTFLQANIISGSGLTNTGNCFIPLDCDAGDKFTVSSSDANLTVVLSIHGILIDA